MKQHITIEQLWELAKNNNDWESITNYNTLAKIRFPGGVTRSNTFAECCKFSAEQTTIGKMIEILGKRFKSMNRSNIDGCTKYQVCFNHLQIDKIFGVCQTKEGDIICDALWEAVKYVLEKELESEGQK